MPSTGALLAAILAACGNAIFVIGQKKATATHNPFVFILVAVATCLGLLCIAAPLAGKSGLFQQIRTTLFWGGVGGIGLFVTYYGFHLLYGKYGASHYILYAVISILTTSIGVGVLMFKESFNRFHLLSLILALLTVVAFSIGQSRS